MRKVAWWDAERAGLMAVRLGALRVESMVAETVAETVALKAEWWDAWTDDCWVVW